MFVCVSHALDLSSNPETESDVIWKDTDLISAGKMAVFGSNSKNIFSEVGNNSEN